MKKFLQNTALFLLPLVVLLYPLDYFISVRLAQSGSDSQGETKTWNTIYNGTIASNVVIYGSSRATMHFNTKTLSKGLCASTYNLGMVANNFWLQYFKHTQYLKYNAKPKYILLSIDALSMEKRISSENLTQFLPYTLFNRDLAQYTAGHDEFPRADFYAPLLRYMGNYPSIFAAFKSNDTVNLSYRGYNPDRPLTPKKFWINAAKKTRAIDPEMWQLLKRLVAQCKRDGITLVFINTPVYNNSDGALFIKNSAPVMTAIKAYAKQQNILYLEYTNNSLCHNEANFYNITHLNKKGTEVFNQQLISDLKKYEPAIINCGN